MTEINMDTVDKVIEDLEIVKTTVEWNCPIDIQIKIDNAIKLLKNCGLENLHKNQ